MLQLSNLECGYDSFSLKISNLSQTTPLLFVIGPNGTGKTTLMKTLAGVLPPRSGLCPIIQCSYLPAQHAIQPGVTGHDIFELYDGDKSKWSNKKIQGALGSEILMDKKIEHLSSGELQRVLLTSVLSHPADVVLLDEPLTYLDWNYSLRLADLINNHFMSGRKFIISNHNLGWCLRFKTSQTWVLYQNGVILDGATETLLKHPKLMEIFKVKTEITDNPIDQTKLLAISKYES